MEYSGPLRRRMRAGRRLVTASTHPPVWRDGVVLPTFWWDGHPNFGDDLTPWLLPHYGIVPVYRSPRVARLAGVGSILEFLPESFDGAIWGPGLMYDRVHQLLSARVLAVRGPFTHDLIGASGDVAFGDPGILVERHVRRPRTKWEIGIVPHGHHRMHEGLRTLATQGGERVRVINVHQSAPAAAGEIAACSSILTTSLHGLVVADSFGIPAAWTLLEPPLEGGDFKFRDYEAVITPETSRFVHFDEDLSLKGILRATRRADAGVVAGVAGGLVSALGGLSKVLGELSPFPLGVASVLRSRVPIIP